MRVAIINALSVGSTGTIAKQIRDTVNRQGGIAEVFTGCWKPGSDTISFGYKFENMLSGGLSKVTGFHHIYSVLGTVSLIRKLELFSPDIVHLHNLHLWVLDVPMLMNYLKKRKVKVVWTLHDCWGFTGRCPHFQVTGCDRWRFGCGRCPYPRNEYPQVFLFDQSARMWKSKRKWFSGFEEMTIVTPSEWLTNLVHESFLKEYTVCTINNGVDLKIFQRRDSDFRERYGLRGEKLILGVAFDWGYRKGLDIFCKLSEKLDDGFRIVLVGTTNEIDKVLPKNIISIHRTANKTELAEIYSAADVFLNPTREDTFPTVNIESLACGTPVITFRTGGSPETVDTLTGMVLEKQDVDSVEKAIVSYCTGKPLSAQVCRQRAVEKYNSEDRFMDYYELFRSL